MIEDSARKMKALIVTMTVTGKGGKNLTCFVCLECVRLMVKYFSWQLFYFWGGHL